MPAVCIGNYFNQQLEQGFVDIYGDSPVLMRQVSGHCCELAETQIAALSPSIRSTLSPQIRGSDQIQPPDTPTPCVPPSHDFDGPHRSPSPPLTMHMDIAHRFIVLRFVTKFIVIPKSHIMRLYTPYRVKVERRVNSLVRRPE